MKHTARFKEWLSKGIQVSRLSLTSWITIHLRHIEDLYYLSMEWIGSSFKEKEIL
jgi:hypothetical protein